MVISVVIQPSGVIGVQNNDTDELDATLNWWGSSSGPTTGMVIGNVDYDPWTVQYACDGFAYPLDSGEPVAVEKNRVLPLKATLTDSDDGITPPIVQVVFESSSAAAAIDVSDDILSASHASEGNEFEYIGDGVWQFNLQASRYTAKGTYTVTMVSGNSCEYIISNPATAEFVIE